jgi:hypothetical protein
MEVKAKTIHHNHDELLDGASWYEDRLGWKMIKKEGKQQLLVATVVSTSCWLLLGVA